MKLIFEDFYEVENFPFYGEDAFDKIKEAEKLDEFEQYIENHYPDGITAKELCECILWNENTMNEIYKEIGIETEEEQ